MIKLKTLNFMHPWLLAGIAGLIFWALFFLIAPTWAGWTLAILLGILSSFALGFEFKRQAERYIQRTEAKKRDDLQKDLDDASYH